MSEKKFRFLLIQAFHLPKASPYLHRPVEGTKQTRLMNYETDEIGWEIPVLEGYRCAITLAKAMVSLGVDAGGLMFPGDRPKKWRRKKVF